jgi:hypothetical protein
MTSIWGSAPAELVQVRCGQARTSSPQLVASTTARGAPRPRAPTTARAPAPAAPAAHPRTPSRQTARAPAPARRAAADGTARAASPPRRAASQHSVGSGARLSTPSRATHTNTHTHTHTHTALPPAAWPATPQELGLFLGTREWAAARLVCRHWRAHITASVQLLELDLEVRGKATARLRGKGATGGVEEGPGCCGPGVGGGRRGPAADDARAGASLQLAPGPGLEARGCRGAGQRARPAHAALASRAGA